MSHRQGPAPVRDASPKGMVADHWTFRDDVWWVTGWHPKPKRGRQQAEPELASFGRGLVTTSGGRAKSAAPKERQGKLL